MVKELYFAQLNGIPPFEIRMYPEKYADEIASILDSDPDFISYKINQREKIKSNISDAADRYVIHEANAPLQDELRILAAQPNPHYMILENLAWGRPVFREAEIRKSQVDAGLYDDGNYGDILDFSMFGKKPHTVSALWIAGLITL